MAGPQSSWEGVGSGAQGLLVSSLPCCPSLAAPVFEL